MLDRKEMWEVIVKCMLVLFVLLVIGSGTTVWVNTPVVFGNGAAWINERLIELAFNPLNQLWMEDIIFVGWMFMAILVFFFTAIVVDYYIKGRKK
jgi:hypothetical protein